MQRTPPLAPIRPYLVRAWYEWCVDQDLTPYLTVAVDGTVRVPQEYVKEDKIVLNVGPEAVSSLSIGNDVLEFKARFAGVVRQVWVPIGRIVSIHARENGQGMLFGPPEEAPQASDAAYSHSTHSSNPRQWPSGLHSMPGLLEEMEGKSDPPPPPRGRPALRRVK
ncbi:stringent starvation protein B [Candidatus Symbiobacter mobilis CR]|uniref:Stringent starvation protein B n=2 Tax=Candidatus Symbiobacter TaxID=1436289 RepID=U5N585_9BURK|nr:stringent starvation protein B [Candidatus Symbiobacter mobilis CR]